MLKPGVAALSSLVLITLASGAFVRPGRPSSDAWPVLSQTGLYSNPSTFEVDPRNLPYAPQYPLWSDGASKRRWISLPPGTRIDASDPDVWTFPAGTRIWKEFSFHGRKVETRYIEALPGGDWRALSYAWRGDGSEADLVPPEGVLGVVEIRSGIRHDIPSRQDCRACHVSRRFEVLGFGGLQLSSDRDPNAVHREELVTDMIDLTKVIGRRMLQSFPGEWAAHPPRIESVSPRARAALGYLHGNCGNCHNPGGPGNVLNLLLRHSLDPGRSGEPALVTGLGRSGRFWIPGVARGGTFMILAGNPERSAIVYRLGTRDPYRQMPPLGTKLVDEEAVELIRSWIANDLAAGTQAGGSSDRTKGGT